MTVLIDRPRLEDAFDDLEEFCVYIFWIVTAYIVMPLKEGLDIEMNKFNASPMILCHR